ncbi:oxidoreductase [Chitinophaga alhagiae]|uniref:Oxidoreductase n=2 Tax=Chitinophaga alhagiae TaxID=2203219 RepID=A0ABN5LWI5_9BACT|nr:oxidoreductase [Chitinophaga alhagiae]
MIKLGIIGMSPGNAHPYSWSSIINGQFDAGEIIKAGYPAVADYLQVNQDTLGIPHARVARVWTQDELLSRSIARSAGIDRVVENMEDMVSEVDAVILARDDPHQHVQMAHPFIEAGIPLFVDKPLAATIEDLKWFRQAVQAGKKLMSCSSMRYAAECRTAKTELPGLGNISFVSAVGKKDWLKYGVHMLEALFFLLDDPRPVRVKHIGTAEKASVQVRFESGIHAMVHLIDDISPTFQLHVYGKQHWKFIDIRNSYAMFRQNIQSFLQFVETGVSPIEFYKTDQIIQVVIAGILSYENGGQEIQLPLTI